MKATEAKLLDFLKKSPQFVIPIYQRTYSWTEKECRQLWDDIVRCGSNDKIAVHFVGSIVYIESGLSQVTHQAPLLVIDGQQRLSTVTLMLAALAEAVADGEPFDGFSQRKIRNYFLLNPEESGDRNFKLKTGELPNINAVYDAFKDHARASRDSAVDDNVHIEALVRDIRDYARHFCAMALGTETDPDLKRAFHDLRELKVDVAYPFLLELYHDYAMGFLPKDDFARSVRLVEAYVFRRTICAIPTNSMNKTFATFTKALKKDRYLESIKAQLLLLPSYRRFPNDDEFHRDLQTRDLYNFRSRSYWLRRFENHGRKEHVPVDEYTIEHIMPQNEQLGAAWRSALGTEWQRIQQTWLHTLGNLTLTGYNSEYSDRPFTEKRDMDGGFKQSPLKLNDGLGQLEQWNEEAIKTRAGKLAGLAVRVWTGPQLDAAVLATYQPRQVSYEAYSIQDHPNLLAPSLHPVFEAFRKAVLALDPCVTEEFLKTYVAYKAETNFVDVVPQAKRLRLALNMRFAEINDPKGLCKDVTGIGRWGNGDIDVGLSTLDELPYVIGLVRQSLELQLGNGSEA